MIAPLALQALMLAAPPPPVPSAGASETPQVATPAADQSDAPADPLAASATPAAEAPVSGRVASDRSAPSQELSDPLADPAGSSAVDADTTPPKIRHASGDPFENVNRKLFDAHERFDKRFFRPVALAYKHVVPKFLRDALRNFFSNLGEPIVFLNDLLQRKFGRAGETFIRFAVDSVYGLAGTIDLAKRPSVGIPHHDNSFGDTLGVYGVGPGPYLFLPFVGPTTVRDLVGGGADGLVLPVAVGTPFDQLYYRIPKGAITGLDKRAQSDAELKALFAGAVDPYATLRSVYLQDRAAEIARLRGKRHRAAPDAPKLGEPLADPADTRSNPAGSMLSDPLADPAQSSDSSAPPELDDPLADPADATPAPAHSGH